MFEKAKAVWLLKKEEKNEHAVFVADFEYSGGETILCVSCESDYIAYLNGEKVSFCAFAGFPNEKYYDRIDVSDKCIKGRNVLVIKARYEGVDSLTHIDSGAMVIFEVWIDGKTAAYSSEDTLSSLDGDYIQHNVRTITGQLGLASDMKYNDHEDEKFEKSRIVPLNCRFLERPVERLVEEKRAEGKKLDIEGRNIYDLSRETAGYLYATFECENECDIKVAYGEHINDGCVRYLIGGRNFSLDFKCKKGKNTFTQYYVRLAGRYLEVFLPEGAKVKEIGLIPVLYPLSENENRFSGIDKKIYEVSVRTLRLCMHTHYEDCAWREQALYVLDSRNQMLSGYYAFKEHSFQRANLVFLSKGKRSDGMLELTVPSVNTPAIPFFSCMYPVEVYEYVENTKDASIINEVIDSMMGIMTFLKGRIGENGLINDLPAPYWNFYEWSDHNTGYGLSDPENTFDLILNCAYVYSSERFEKMCDMIGERFDSEKERVKKAIEDTFFDCESGAFYLSDKEKNIGEVGCAFALLAGLGNEKTCDYIIGKKEAVRATLSMKGFSYDALLSFGDKYKDYVVDDIRKNYSYMLENGATSFWETIKGEKDFGNAGSLCHGWSAIPVYYFSKLL